MSISYEGIGAWCATFAGAELSEGAAVKASANGTVSACSAGEQFCGVVAAVSRDKSACSVQLAGFAEVKYSGSTAPEVGYCTLAADGQGGVCVNESGRSHLVVEKNAAESTVTIML